MDHSFYQERLSAYLDRELPAEEMEAVAEHLAGCAECIGRIEQLKSLDRFTSKHSVFDESDYWERSAQRIEARIASETGKITDIKRARGGLYAGLWWKLPAIAASIVIVGYIGLHESEIVRDGRLIPPTEQAAPDVRPTDDQSLRNEATSEADQPIDREIQAEPKVESGEAAGTETKRSRQDVGQAISRPGVSEPESIAQPKPEAIPDAGRVVPPSPESPRSDVVGEHDLADRYKTAAPKASSLGQATPVDAADRETVAADDIQTEQALQEETNMIEMAPPPPGRAEEVLKAKVSKDEYDKIKVLEETASGFTDGSSNLVESTEDSEELESWRDRRDSLVSLKSVMVKGTAPSAAKASRFGAVTKLREDASTSTAVTDTTKAALERVEVDLVEAWYRVCLLSDDELEINRGTEYLKEVAFNLQSKSGERARRYLELLGR